MFAVALVSRRVVWIALILGAVTGLATNAMGTDTDDATRIRRAITYLDARQEAWSQFASAQRGQGTDKTTCVSCHTGISYALARPALRRFATVSGLTVPEERMIVAVNLRVEHWAELDSPRFRLMYDSDDQKKTESRGTEAVLNVLILARKDATSGRAKAGSATQAALEHLWSTQITQGTAAGSWDWLNFGLEPWEADGSRVFGTVLAAIAVSSTPQYMDRTPGERASTGIRLLREYLRRQFPTENLYNRLWILEASTTFEGLLSAEQKHEVVDQVLPLQRGDGGWSLATLGSYKRVDGTKQLRDSDGYATGLVLHALLRAGLPTTRSELAHGFSWLRSHQQADGSWPGRSVNKERDPATFIGHLMSDAATAIAALALVEAEVR